MISLRCNTDPNSGDPKTGIVTYRSVYWGFEPLLRLINNS